MTRVLFVCIGNSCRSQMAEGFARTYGKGVIEVESAGLAPATTIAPLTRDVMDEKGIDLGDQIPKPLDWVKPETFDLIVSLCGCPVPGAGSVPILYWDVLDPIGQSLKVYRRVRDEIEGQVLALIKEQRSRL